MFPLTQTEINVINEGRAVPLTQADIDSFNSGNHLVLTNSEMIRLEKGRGISFPSFSTPNYTPVYPALEGLTSIHVEQLQVAVSVDQKYIKDKTGRDVVIVR